MHWLGMVGIGAVLLIAILYAAATPIPPQPNQTQAAGYRFGTFFASFLIPVLVAYVVAGRKKARNPNLFAILFCSICLGLIFFNAAGRASSGVLHGPESSDQKINRLMREAAGLQPVYKPLFGEDPVDATLRDMFSELIALNKQYQAAADKLDISQVSTLNTAEAFADPDSVTRGLAQLHASYDLDATQEQRMQQMIDKFRRKFGDLSSSSADRQTLIKSFNEGLAKSSPARQRAVSAEKDWIEAVDNVYAYARLQHAHFKLSNGRLVISNDAVLQEFNSRVDAMNHNRDAFLQAKHQLDDFQRKILQKVGVTPEQTGTRPQ